MPVNSTVKHNFHFSVGYLKLLLEGIDAGKLAAQPLLGMNHPLWIVGHVACAIELCSNLSGANYKAPEGWDALFGMKSEPVGDASKYPDIQTLLAELDKGVESISPALDSITDAQLAAQMPDEGFRSKMPTIGDGLTFMLNGHVTFHVGQLSAWRRAIGLPPLF